MKPKIGIWASKELKQLLRSSRRAEERIFPQRLKWKPLQKPCHTLPLKTIIMLGAIIDIHNYNEHSNISHNKHRNKPGSPLGFGIFNHIRGRGEATTSSVLRYSPLISLLSISCLAILCLPETQPPLRVGNWLCLVGELGWWSLVKGLYEVKWKRDQLP